MALYSAAGAFDYFIGGDFGPRLFLPEGPGTLFQTLESCYTDPAGKVLSSFLMGGKICLLACFINKNYGIVRFAEANQYLSCYGYGDLKRVL